MSKPSSFFIRYSFILLFSILVFIGLLAIPLPVTLQRESSYVLAISVLIILFWVFEVFPFAVTALLPLVLFSLFGVFPLAEISGIYMSPVILLFLGGFMMAIALEKSGLHTRIARNILKVLGGSPVGILGGFILATSLLSMWISNTATAVMMVAIAMPLIKEMKQTALSDFSNQLGGILLLSIAYAANIGGISTLIGTPPNAVLVGLMRQSFNLDLSFGQWFLYAAPIALIMLSFLFLHFSWRIKQLHISRSAWESLGSKLPLQSETWKAEEKIVAVIFLFAITGWFSRGWVNEWVGYKLLDDATIAVLAGIMPFMIPAGFQKKEFIVHWKDTYSLPWNVLLLFGGGMTLAYGLEQGGLIHYSANYLLGSLGEHTLLILLILPAIMLFMTELMGNVAIVSIFIPLAFEVGNMLGLPPAYFAYPITICSSFAFMLPIATPPNAIVYASGHIEIGSMIRKGFVMNLVGLCIVILFNYFYFHLY